jgi:hypothetical protein
LRIFKNRKGSGATAGILLAFIFLFFTFVALINTYSTDVISNDDFRINYNNENLSEPKHPVATADLLDTTTDFFDFLFNLFDLIFFGFYFMSQGFVQIIINLIILMPLRIAAAILIYTLIRGNS